MADEPPPPIPRSCIVSDGAGRVIELGENNAPRRCITCGENSDFYVFLGGVMSTFYCRKHFRAAERKPLEDINA